MRVINIVWATYIQHIAMLVLWNENNIPVNELYITLNKLNYYIGNINLREVNTAAISNGEVMIIKKVVKAFVVANVIGYTVYKLRLDEKLIRAIESTYRELVASLKPKTETK